MEDPIKVAFVSLGCAKNVVDSEKMLGQLAEAGCVVTDNEAEADVAVVNTCGFLSAAREEADEIIRELVDLKGSGGPGRIVVAGCLVQRDKEKILERIEGIDAIVGVHNRDDVVRAVLGVRDAKPKRGQVFLSDYHPFVQVDTARLRITPEHYAYLRISEGCDQHCTFCTIPAIRGRMHCKPPEVILAEARELLGDGVVELNVIGQDTTSYGLGEDPIEGGIAGLIRQLNDLDGAPWIRLMYAYPTVFSDELIDAIDSCENVCNYVDIPLQHISDRVLAQMGRRVDRKRTEALLTKLRARIADVAIRTTLIVGFPGETDAEFEELLEFVKSFGFDALGVFPFSPEPDTPAGRMEGQISEEVKADRVDAIMSAQQQVVAALAKRFEGRELEVLAEEYDENGILAGRHRGQAPEVDGLTLLQGCDAAPGELVTVRCVGYDGYDLLAKPV